VLARLAERMKGGLKGLTFAADARRPARIVQVLPLGPGSRLLVVAFGGRHVLVGQSRAGLSRLAAGLSDEQP
jgi:hypothetical protein